MAKRPKKTPKEEETLKDYEIYADKVRNGEIIANKWVRLACRRYFEDHKHKKEKGLDFSYVKAQKVINFFETALTFYEGDFDGKPFLLQPWQKFILANIFGWQTLDKYRRFRTAYIEAAKGCGKSPMAAGIGLYGLVADGEPGAEIYAAATQKEQASILFRDAKAFAESSSMLNKHLTVGIANIAYPGKNSFFRPISSEHRGLDGKRPHMALIDEIHEHPNALVVDKMRAGTKGRTQALIFEITNSGYDRHSVCYQHHEYSEKILQGIVENDSWFAYMTGLDICEDHEKEGKIIPQEGCPKCDDWRDETVWPKANPNIGISIKEKYLREQVNEAIAMPSKENIVKRLNFCIWTESVTKWLGDQAWMECLENYREEDLYGRICFAGLDLSSNIDTTAYILVFIPTEEDPSFKILPRFFIPEENMTARVRRDRVPYDVWVRQGFMTATDGNVVDYDFIKNQIELDCQTFDLRDICFDPWNATQLMTDLQKSGFEDEKQIYATRHLVKYRQGLQSLGEPTKKLEKMVFGKEIAHNGHPVLRWQVANAVVHRDAKDNLIPDKAKSTDRIDGVVALIMGLDRAVLMSKEILTSALGISFI